MISLRIDMADSLTAHGNVNYHLVMIKVNCTAVRRKEIE